MPDGTSARPCRLCGGPRDSRKNTCAKCLTDPPVWRACQQCQAVFKCGYFSGSTLLTRKFCSEDCRKIGIASKLSALKADPAKEGETSRCPQCGKTFATWRHRKGKGWRKREYCSNACAQTVKMTGRQATHYTCKDCGATCSARGYAPSATRCVACATERKRRDKRQRSHNKRQYIIDRDRHKCRSCKRQVLVTGDPTNGRYAEIDHVVPRAQWPKGLSGLNDPANLQLLCRDCNQAKGAGATPGGDQLMLVG